MHPYWLMFENPPRFPSLGLGAGVTAHSEEDARKISSEAFGAELVVKEIRVIQTMDEVEQNHVRPNMGNFLVRGVWYPQGFS